MLNTAVPPIKVFRPEVMRVSVPASMSPWPSTSLQILTAVMSASTAVPLERTVRLFQASANCVVVSGKRAGEERLAACVVRADTRADVNNLVKRTLDVRKASFHPMDSAVEETGMEYGGITPVGLPDGWRLLLDADVVDIDVAIIGSGVRRSKLLLPGALLAELPGAEVVPALAG